MKKLFLRGLLLFGGIVPVCSASRVISLSPAATELICHLGAGKLLAGRSSACDYPENVKRLPVFGDFARPDTAKILAAKPDLLVTNDLIVPGAARIFRQNGIKVLFLPCRSVKEYCSAVERLGKELQRQKEARKELQRVKKFIESCRKSVGKRVVLPLIWSSPVIVCGEGTFCGELLSLAGARLPELRGTKGYFKPSGKWLLSCGADTLLVFQEPGALKRHPLLRLLEPVRKNRIIYFPEADLLQRPGPRFTEGVLLLKRRLEQ